MIKYHPAPDIQARMTEIVGALGMKHVDMSRVVFIRSKGSAARRTLARCHGFPRIFQVALGVKAHYIIEIISEKFDKLSLEEQDKTLIHEMMHIPKAFGGGFRFHDFVSRESVEQMYEKYRRRNN